jgi:hypothetical protein
LLHGVIFLHEMLFVVFVNALCPKLNRVQFGVQARVVLLAQQVA